MFLVKCLPACLTDQTKQKKRDKKQKERRNETSDEGVEAHLKSGVENVLLCIYFAYLTSLFSILLFYSPERISNQAVNHETIPNRIIIHEMHFHSTTLKSFSGSLLFLCVFI